MRLSRLLLLGSVLAFGVAGVAVAALNASAANSGYSITDLGSLGLASDGYAINANGQVTGGSYLTKTYQIPCPPGYPNPPKCVRHPKHAFLYSNGQMSDLGTLNGGNNSQGNAINLSGQVAGWSDTSSGNDAVVWSGNKTIDVGALKPLAKSDSIADGINDAGQVVGTWGTNTDYAFLYSNGTISHLPEPSFTGSFGCEGLAINNKSQIAGVCWDKSDNAHLVLWQNGTVSDLGMLGTAGSVAIVEALSINSNGQIAGWFGSSTGNNGFLYSNGTLTDLGSFLAASINDNGVMVGGPSIDNGGTIQNLNNLIPAGSGYQIQDATAINNAGQIVANANDTASGQTHALLLNPS